jgi:alpha-tubulin suppressor-like RCC1 family protein
LYTFVPGSRKVVKVTASEGAFAALFDDGTVYVWGLSATETAAAAVSSQLVNVVKIAATSTAFAAIRDDGSVVAWGPSNAGGSVGSKAQYLTSGVVEIFTTEVAFAALKDDGSVVTWGFSASGGDSSSAAGSLTSGVVTETRRTYNRS